MWLKTHMIRLTNVGSVDDIRASLRLSEPKMSISDLKKNMEAEKKYAKRVSVINLFQAAINRKIKAKK